MVLTSLLADREENCVPGLLDLLESLTQQAYPQELQRTAQRNLHCHRYHVFL